MKNYSGNTSSPHKPKAAPKGKSGGSAFGANTNCLKHTGGNKGVIHRNSKTNMKPSGSGSVVR